MEPEHGQYLVYRRARFTANLPRACLYTAAHFWICPRGADLFRVGLTKFGSRLLGEIVDYGFDVSAGSRVAAGQKLGWLEGFKAVSELHSLAEGIFLDPNPALEKQVTLLHEDPFGAGWLYAVKGTPDPGCVAVEAYARVLDGEIDRWQSGQ